VTDHSGYEPSHRPLVKHPQLIEEARRHQRRRRGITGTALLAMLGIGGLVVGLSFDGADEPGRTVGTSASTSPATTTQGQRSPSSTETSEPPTLGSVLASERAAAAQAAENEEAALQAAESAAAAATATQSERR
jgi:hypothetical protein